MPKKTPAEIHNFIVENQSGMRAKDLAEMVNARFGTKYTETAMKAYRSNHHLQSGRPKGTPEGQSKMFPPNIHEYIVKNHKGTGHLMMAEMVNAEFGTAYSKEQIKNFYSRHKLNSGLTGRFEKGHVPANKGTHPPTRGRMAETQFKKGNLPYDTKPIGYERINKDGYIEVKIKMRPSSPDCNDNFKAKHILVWEQANGKVPAGHNVIFKDGNKQNIALDNLALVSKAEHLELTRSKLRSTDADVTETGILIARIKCTSRKRKKELRQGG